jgi:putative peptidoglycan lipid II flippase
MSTGSSSANRQIARAAGTVMLAFVVAQLAGLARRVLVADAFGATSELDAFLAANRVSETLFNLVAGGALGSAFIPAFTGLLVKDQNSRAWRLASAIANLVFLVLGVLALLAGIFAPQIVRHVLVDPAFAADPYRFNLTVTLLRIQLGSAVLFGLSGLVMGVLNAHQVFLIPALAPAMYQFGLIFGVLTLAPGMGIYGLAWGVVIGAAGHLLLQIPTLLRRRGSYTLTLGWGDANVGEVMRLMGPRLLGVAVVQLNFWVNTRLASGMETGSVTGVDYGFALMLMAQVAIAQSIATAAMPTLAAQYARADLVAVRHSLSASLRSVLLLALPATAGLILLRYPLIELLYQRGNFTARATELVAWALLWYAAGLVGHAVMEVLARAFYALHDTRTPVMIGIVAMSLNVAFSFGFAALFRRWGWQPHGGLALANSLATALEAAALWWLMRRRLSGLEGDRMARTTAKALLATAIMAVFLLLWSRQLANQPAWLLALGGVGLGGLVYAIMIALLRVEELNSLTVGLWKRWLGRRQKSP